MLPDELQQKLAPVQKQLEQYRQALLADEERARQRARKKFKLVAAICIVGLLGAIAGGYVAGLGTANTLIMVIPGGVLITALVFGLTTKDTTEFSTAYSDAYKTEINNAIVKHISPALSYIQEDGINRETFVACGLFPAPDR